MDYMDFLTSWFGSSTSPPHLQPISNQDWQLQQETIQLVLPLGDRSSVVLLVPHACSQPQPCFIWAQLYQSCPQCFFNKACCLLLWSTFACPKLVLILDMVPGLRKMCSMLKFGKKSTNYDKKYDQFIQNDFLLIIRYSEKNPTTQGQGEKTGRKSKTKHVFS